MHISINHEQNTFYVEDDPFTLEGNFHYTEDETEVNITDLFREDERITELPKEYLSKMTQLILNKL